MPPHVVPVASPGALAGVVRCLWLLAIVAWVGWRFGPMLTRVAGWCSWWVAWACGSQGGYGYCAAFLLLGALAWEAGRSGTPNVAGVGLRRSRRGCSRARAASAIRSPTSSHRPPSSCHATADSPASHPSPSGSRPTPATLLTALKHHCKGLPTAQRGCAPRSTQSSADASAGLRPIGRRDWELANRAEAEGASSHVRPIGLTRRYAAHPKANG